MTARVRAADDIDAIHRRIQELRDEKQKAQQQAGTREYAATYWGERSGEEDGA